MVISRWFWPASGLQLAHGGREVDVETVNEVVLLLVRVGRGVVGDSEVFPFELRLELGV